MKLPFGSTIKLPNDFFPFITHDLSFDLDFQTCFPPSKNITYFIYTLFSYHTHTYELHMYSIHIYSYVVIMPCFMNCMFSGMDLFHLDATWRVPRVWRESHKKSPWGYPLAIVSTGVLATDWRFEWRPRCRAIMQKLLLSQNVEWQLDFHPAPEIWW